ncbi:MAG: hypothetical protein R2749_05715 [Acidimicrobiales bacterium]
MPTFVLVLLLRRIPPDPGGERRPGRGGALWAMRAAYGALEAVPSLRRFWAVAFFLSWPRSGCGAGLALLRTGVGLRRQGPWPRQFFIGIGWTAGVWLGGQVTQRRLEEVRPPRSPPCAATPSGCSPSAGGAGGWLRFRPAVVALTVLAIGNGVWPIAVLLRRGSPGATEPVGQAFALHGDRGKRSAGCARLAIGAVGGAQQLPRRFRPHRRRRREWRLLAVASGR